MFDWPITQCKRLHSFSPFGLLIQGYNFRQRISGKVWYHRQQEQLQESMGTWETHYEHLQEHTGKQGGNTKIQKTSPNDAPTQYPIHSKILKTNHWFTIMEKKEVWKLELNTLHKQNNQVQCSRTSSMEQLQSTKMNTKEGSEGLDAFMIFVQALFSTFKFFAIPPTSMHWGKQSISTKTQLTFLLREKG